MTADFIREAIKKKYNDVRRYAIAEEVGLTTGFSHRRLDMMVLDCYESNGFRIDGIEIKVSTGDLRRELQDPEKHCAFYPMIDYFSLAVPDGVVNPLMDVIPKKWGIIIVCEDGSARFKRRPLAFRDSPCDGTVPRGFFACVVRNIQSHQPSSAELKAAYDKGVEVERKRYDYDKERVRHDAAELEAYQKLKYQLNIWKEDIDDPIKAFEAFRELNMDWILQHTRLAINQLTELVNYLVKAEVRK